MTAFSFSLLFFFFKLILNFSLLFCIVEAPNPSNLHPYEAEIKNLIENPESFEDLYSDHQKMSDFFSYVWIETEAQLKDLAHTLSKHKVFAVDTEQHSLRSFLGFTALIQVKLINK